MNSSAVNQIRNAFPVKLKHKTETVTKLKQKIDETLKKKLRYKTLKTIKIITIITITIKRLAARKIIPKAFSFGSVLLE